MRAVDINSHVTGDVAGNNHLSVVAVVGHEHGVVGYRVFGDKNRIDGRHIVHLI